MTLRAEIWHFGYNSETSIMSELILKKSGRLGKLGENRKLIHD